MNTLSIDDLLSKKLVIFTGKGGIGKSLVTAACGQLAVDKGMRVLLVEKSDQEQIAPLFGHKDIGHNEVEISENLSCINLDTTKCFEEYVVKQLGQKKLFERVFSNNIVKTFLNTIPGLGESMLLGRIFYTCELADPAPYDIVLFDAPASGHMQNLMTTPEAIINSGIGGPLVREVSRVRDFLAESDKVGTVVVAVPEELVISEVLEFLPKLKNESPAKLIGVLINRTVAKSEIEQLKNYAGSVEGEDLKNLTDFLLTRYLRSVENQEHLISELNAIGEKGDIGAFAFLPELGTVKEPLPPGFGKTFFKDLIGE